MRTSVLICTPDSTTERFRKCYDAVINTTRGISFDFRIVDNRKTTQFSQQEEINRAVHNANGPVINMDDDVIVLGDWMPALLECDRLGVGMAACSTTISARLDKEIKVPSTGLCCTMLNALSWPDCISVDVDYKKYFFDPDLCFQLWEQGLEVCVIPHRIIHNSGGGMAELGVARKPLFDHDKQRFCEVWIDSGRYEAIRQEHGHKWAGELRKSLYE